MRGSHRTYDARRWPAFAAGFAAIAILAGGWDASAAAAGAGPLVRPALRHDTSRPLRDIVKDYPAVPGALREQPLREGPALTKRVQLAADPVLQKEYNIGHRAPSLDQNWEGISNVDGVAPPDTNGDVGPDHYVQMVNLSTAIWDKSGNEILGAFSSNAFWAGFGGSCQTSNDGDPVVLYDQWADRFWVTQFAVSGNFLCIAVSQTGDPTGSYHRYAYADPNGYFPDYPKFGLTPNGLFASSREFGGGYQGVAAWAFERDQMLLGATADMVYHLQAGENGDAMLPMDVDGTVPPPLGTPAFYAQVHHPDFGGSATEVAIFAFDVDWSNPAASTFTLQQAVPITAFELDLCGYSNNCIPQPGTAQAIADLATLGAMFRFPYRNFGSYQSVLFNHTVDLGGDRAGIRWYEFRTTDDGSTWAVEQEGTYGPADTEHRWMASVAMDSAGNLALGHSISSGTVSPGIRIASRTAGDPSGTLPQPELNVINGSGSQLGTNRWGDYSAMVVDPADDCTFWYTTEYVETTGSFNWQTRVASFTFAECTATESGSLDGYVTDAGTTAPIEGATVTAGAFQTVTDAAGYYRFAVLPVDGYTVTASAYGYADDSATVTIVDGGAETQDFALAALPVSTITGTVTDTNTGMPLYATIDIGGSYPYGDIYTNPETGAYSVDLLEGETYPFTVNAIMPGYYPATRDVTAPSGGATEDFALSVDTVACNAPGYTKPVLFLEDFEADDGGFTTSGAGSSWEWGEPTSGPGEASSGAQVWATNLGGNYNDDEQSYLSTGDIDLSSQTGNSVTLGFKHWLSVENGWDYASVQVSSNGGTSWQTVWGPATGAVAAEWTSVAIALDPAYSTATFRARWFMDADYVITFPGWYIDDVELKYLPVTGYYAEDFESNDGGYAASGTNSTWAYGTPSSGPGGANSGTGAWATNLSGNYDDDESSNLESVDIDGSSLASAEVPVLQWYQYFESEGGWDYGHVDVSSDGGSNWTRVYANLTGAVDADWTRYSVPLAPGYKVNNVRIRWVLESDYIYSYPGWYVDDVALNGVVYPCDAPTNGGLVVGYVTDANTTDPVLGADVTSAAITGSVMSQATPDDDSLGDGYYWSWIGTGTNDVTYSKTGYEAHTGSVTTVDLGVVRHDAALNAGQLTAAVSDIEVTVALNGTASETLTLNNVGTADATYDLKEINAAAKTFSGRFDPPGRQVSPLHVNHIDGTYVRRRPIELPPAAPGDVLQSWPTGLAYGWGAGYDQNADELWLGDVGAAGGTNMAYGYLPDGTATGDVIDTTSWIAVFAADLAYNGLNGMLYQINVGGDNCVYELDPVTLVSTGNSICPSFGTSQRGLAYDPTSDTFFSGSWNDGIIHRFSPDGTLLESVNVALSISGLAYHPGTGSLWVLQNIDSSGPDLVQLDPADSYAVLSTVEITGMPNFGQAGLSIACDGALWAVDQAGQQVFEVDSGEMGTDACGWQDIPWLTLGTTTGTIAVAGSDDVAVDFDSTGLTRGTYQGQIKVDNDTPYGSFRVPVTLNVDQYGSTATPDQLAASGDPGAQVTYVVTVENTATWLSDSYDISVTGDLWPASADVATVGPLAAGATAVVTVTVDISANAVRGQYDYASIEVRSQGDATAASTVTFETTVSEVYGVDAPDGSATGNPGSIVTHTVVVENTGSVEDTFDMASSGGTWTLSAPATVGPLAPHAATAVMVTVDVPAGAAGGDDDTWTLELTSQGDGTVSDTAALTTTAASVYGVAATDSQQTGDFGQVLTHTVTVTNTGNTSDTYTIAVTGNNWATTAPGSVGPIAAGASEDVTVEVTLPVAKPEDEARAAVVVSDTAELTFTSQAQAGVEANASVVSASARPVPALGTLGLLVALVLVPLAGARSLGRRGFRGR